MHRTIRFVTVAALTLVLSALAEPVFAQTDSEFCRKFPSDEYAVCMATREYIAKAKAVVAGNGLCLPKNAPRGMSGEYFLPDDENIITDAIVKSLSGTPRCKEVPETPRGPTPNTMTQAEAVEFCRKFPSDEYAVCMSVRDYIAKAKSVADGNGCLPPNAPKGYGPRYLVRGDDEILSDAIVKSVSGGRCRNK